MPVIAREGRTMPLVDLGLVLDAPGERDPRAAVVVHHGGAGELLALAVDELEGELEVVVKELGGSSAGCPRSPARPSTGTAAWCWSSTCASSPSASWRRRAGTPGAPAPGAPAAGEPGRAAAAPGRPATVLVVEDSVGVRELQRVILEGAGYDVVTAVDGLDGAARLGRTPVDLVLSDVEMPGMDGFTLTRTLRRTRGWEDVPVVIMTSRGDEADQRAGLDAGASAYLLKSEFDQAELIDTVRRLLGR